MTVAKFTQPNYLTQTAAAYKAALDAAIAVLATVGTDYACHAKDTPDMQVLVDAGQLFLANSTLVSNAQQTSATIVAPVTNPRIDRIVINDQTGVVSVITGAEAASPAAPAITAGTRPIAQILLQTSSTTIANSMITDERVVTTFDVSTFMRTFLDDADAATASATLGVPRLDAVSNTFTGIQAITSAAPNITFTETGVTADNGRWDFAIDGEAWRLRATNDAGGSATNVIIVQRTGLTVDSIILGGPLTLSGTLTAPGIINATGGQIQFPATQNPSSDANALDDYEEGTWLPNVGGTATYGSRAGVYVKIGQLVFISWFLEINILGTGALSTISGLPFTARNVPGVPHDSGSCNYWDGIATARITLIPRVGTNTSSMDLIGLAASSVSMVTVVNIFADGARVAGTAVYRAAA